MERDELIRLVSERPEALSVVRHARNALRYYRLSVGDLATLLLACERTAPSDNGRTNMFCSLGDGTEWCVTVKMEDDELVVITVVDKTPSHQRTPRSRR